MGRPTAAELDVRRERIEAMVARSAPTSEILAALGMKDTKANRDKVHRDRVAIRKRNAERVLHAPEIEAEDVGQTIARLEAAVSTAWKKVHEDARFLEAKDAAALLRAAVDAERLLADTKRNLGLHLAAPQRIALTKASDLKDMEGEELLRFIADERKKTTKLDALLEEEEA